MDSLTQAVLGAAVGEHQLGRSIGRKGLVWGAALGTLPDLDVLVYPWLDQVQQLAWHRGLSHSVVAVAVGALVFGALIRVVHRRSQPDRPQLSYGRACSAVAWIWGTHVLIDVFTIYGTQVLEPFSDRRVAIGNLFIIDPLFTLPLLLGILCALVLPRRAGRWSRLNALGLVAATAYACWSLVSHRIAAQRFADELFEQGIPAQRLSVAATPFNTLLWRAVAEVEHGYWIGYASHLDAERRVDFEFVRRREALLGDYAGSRALNALEWFSVGYYTVGGDGDRPQFSDLRFGELRGEGGSLADARHLFSWQLEQDPSGEARFRQRRPERVPLRPEFDRLVRRMLGDRTAWEVPVSVARRDRADGER